MGKTENQPAATLLMQHSKTPVFQYSFRKIDWQIISPCKPIENICKQGE